MCIYCSYGRQETGERRKEKGDVEKRSSAKRKERREKTKVKRQMEKRKVNSYELPGRLSVSSQPAKTTKAKTELTRAAYW